MMLALDPAATLGWAAAEPGGAIKFGTVRFGSWDAPFGATLKDLNEWLTLTIRNLQPNSIIYERPYIPKLNPNAETVFRLAGLAAIIEMRAYHNSVHLTRVTAQDAAKYFTGRARWGGRDKKKQAVIEMCERYGFLVENDNEADAIAILLFGESKLFPQSSCKRAFAGPLFGVSCKKTSSKSGASR